MLITEAHAQSLGYNLCEYERWQSDNGSSNGTATGSVHLTR